MTTPRLTALLGSALLVLTGCLVETRPYAYRTYPPPAPPPAMVPAVTPYAPPPATPPDLPPPPAQEQPEVLTRGPVHEAFAQPVAAQPQPGLVVAGQPPANIVETPPTDRPTGNACVWAPGYWSWDAERSNFIWVSGCWRVAPPKMTWAPGYWTHIVTGWQWVPGFWSPATTQELAYLPTPPATTSIQQPPGPPPSPDEFWVPGCWYWYQGHYMFRAGYWLQQKPGWVWVPSYCAWTPRGYVFLRGYWDYTLENRGVLFAPVCFSERAHAGVALTFAPSITVDLGVLSASLFACPRYEHYYFGDYYDDSYVRIGIYPWFDCVRIGTWYDPVFVYARWDLGRKDSRWEEHARHEYALRHDNRELRPARTYREQETRVSRLPEPERRAHQMARPLSVVVAAPAASIKYEHVDAAAHQTVVKQAEKTASFRDTRSRKETEPQAPAGRAAPGASGRATTPRTVPSDRGSTPSNNSSELERPDAEHGARGGSQDKPRGESRYGHSDER